MLPGKSVNEALKITEKDMLNRLGDLPPLKRHCGKLAELALQSALGDYFLKTQGDKKLLDRVAARIQDPREWDPGIPSEDEAVAEKPL